MPSTASILEKIKSDHPQFIFKPGQDFMWSSSENTIYYDTSIDNQPVYLLHELSHALLGHSYYDRDIELISMERQAWDYTVKLGPSYGIDVANDIVQTNLDSYRNWMHERSICPECESSGLQIKKNIYTCPCCNHAWKVNEARACALRRYDIK